MKTILFAFLVSSLFLFSCINTSREKTVEKQKPKIEESEMHHHDSESLELNNGEKWKVDDNMMVFIQSMEKSIESFSSTNQSDYELLAKSLDKDVKLLTTNCTMSGMAHDELHKWLVPYIGEVNELSQSKDETEAGEAIANIQESFKTFNQYFQ